MVFSNRIFHFETSFNEKWELVGSRKNCWLRRKQIPIISQGKISTAETRKALFHLYIYMKEVD